MLAVCAIAGGALGFVGGDPVGLVVHTSLPPVKLLPYVGLMSDLTIA